MQEQSEPYVITIVGPESSGKTTLARQLSELLGCPWVPEYARKYLSGLDRPYEKEDLEAIAEGQLASFSSLLNDDIPIFSPEMMIGLGDFVSSGSQNEHQRNSFLSFSRSEFGIGSRKVIIVDSGLLSIQMWAEIKYGTTVPLVEKEMRDDMTDLYVLCRPIYSWEEDPLREAPALLDRVWIYNQFLKQLVTMKQ